MQPRLPGGVDPVLSLIRSLLHGHLHSANHDVEKLGDTKVYNVSMLDETYSLKYQPLYMDYIN